jgi:hypothetical protein
MSKFFLNTKTSLMQKVRISILILFANCFVIQPAIGADLLFSTYFGGSGDYDVARDVATDSKGNVFVVGYARSNTLATPGTFDTTHNSPGREDAFIAKFSSTGTLLAATYFGTSGTDFGMGIEIDSNDKVIIAGFAGQNLATTFGVFQQNFNGGDNGIYGYQNGFVARFSNDLSTRQWASYVGTGYGVRSVTLDSSDNIIMPLGHPGHGGTDPSGWFTSAYQSSPYGRYNHDCGVIKVSNDGTTVQAATYLGGSNEDNEDASVAVDSDGNIFLVMHSSSTDLPVPNGHDTSNAGQQDYWLGKFNSSLSSLSWGTYIGNSNDQELSTNHLVPDSSGNIYLAVPASGSISNVIHSGAYDETANGNVDMIIMKFSSAGVFLKGTYLGGSAYENIDGINLDSNGNVIVFGETVSTNWPYTSGAYNTNNSGGGDAVFAILDSDLESLYYSTYMGGSSNDNARGGWIDSSDNIYLAGSSSGSGWPTQNAHQSSHGGGNTDAIVVKFYLGGQANLPPSPPKALTILRMC